MNNAQMAGMRLYAEAMGCSMGPEVDLDSFFRAGFGIEEARVFVANGYTVEDAKAQRNVYRSIAAAKKA